MYWRRIRALYGARKLSCPATKKAASITTAKPRSTSKGAASLVTNPRFAVFFTLANTREDPTDSTKLRRSFGRTPSDALACFSFNARLRRRDPSLQKALEIKIQMRWILDEEQAPLRESTRELRFPLEEFRRCGPQSIELLQMSECRHPVGEGPVVTMGNPSRFLRPLEGAFELASAQMRQSPI